ncbi:conserved hypothetical protein [Culex quinquefasciatus]|uniref:40S ribosomal protein S14 n=1 Tax=Culex quinquefasciatus TaxID=7176 RepID=B0X8V6_CULQU|nr:conserved hypothetical protein [Culex quinquefasciatus]|eukprot:XP_001866078.1 conserved hypothetical protein [Culex quinquefasciatus]
MFRSINEQLLIVARYNFLVTMASCKNKTRKADRDEAPPYAALLAAQDVADKCKSLGITLRATGGNRTKTPRPGAQSTHRALSCSSKIFLIFLVLLV